MNQLAVDIVKLLDKYGVVEDQKEILSKIAENIDRAQLCNDIEQCAQCSLNKSTSHKVAGEGPRNASIMIIGEYSGERENALGRPFVGSAGQLLDKLLFDACIDRNNIYITNAIKCHTPYSRDPDVLELQSCARQFLSRELDIIRPKHIITMGPIAASLFTCESLNKVRGNTIESKGYPVTFTFHPSHILRQDAVNYSKIYNFVVDDLSRVINDIVEKDGDMSACRKLTPEEEKMFKIKE